MHHRSRQSIVRYIPEHHKPNHGKYNQLQQNTPVVATVRSGKPWNTAVAVTVPSARPRNTTAVRSSYGSCPKTCRSVSPGSRNCLTAAPAPQESTRPRDSPTDRSGAAAPRAPARDEEGTVYQIESSKSFICPFWKAVGTTNGSVVEALFTLDAPLVHNKGSRRQHQCNPVTRYRCYMLQ